MTQETVGALNLVRFVNGSEDPLAPIGSEAATDVSTVRGWTLCVTDPPRAVGNLGWLGRSFGRTPRMREKLAMAGE